MDVLMEEKESDPFAIQFPLPDQLDPSQCRDKFLSTIIEDHERRVSSLLAALSLRSKSVVDYAVETVDRVVENGAEAMVVRQMARMRKRESGRKTVQEAIESIKLRSSMMTELNIKCQKAAIEFLSVRLLKQLRLFSSPWPGKIDEIPYNLFKWSLDHFLARLEHNQLYLDVIHRERSSEDLDCVKFRTDLKEIEQILHEMREDFQKDDDLCENSIQLIRYWPHFHQEEHSILETLIFLEIASTTRLVLGLRTSRTIAGSRREWATVAWQWNPAYPVWISIELHS